MDTVLDRLEPAGQGSEHEARLRGTRLVAAGLAQRQDPPQRPVPGGVVAAQRHSGEGGVARRAEQGRARAVLEPDPQRLQAQPRVHGRGGVVGRRQDRHDQAGRGEQRRVGDVRPGQVVGSVGAVQPPVQIAELAVELGGEPVRRRDGDAELTQRLDAKPDRLRETVPVGQAAHLHRRRGRALHRGGRQPLDRCGTPRPPPPTAPGRTARRGGRCAPRPAWRSRPGRSAAARAASSAFTSA